MKQGKFFLAIVLVVLAGAGVFFGTEISEFYRQWLDKMLSAKSQSTAVSSPISRFTPTNVTYDSEHGLVFVDNNYGEVYIVYPFTLKIVLLPELNGTRAEVGDCFFQNSIGAIFYRVNAMTVYVNSAEQKKK